MVKEIELTNGYKALVDDEDYDRINQFKWHYHDGYAARSKWVDGGPVKIMMHREVLGLPFSYVDDRQIDHKDRDDLNNTKCNLRICTQSRNLANNNGHRKNPLSSQYKGVRKRYQRWCAQISVNGVTKNIGTFDTEIEAADAYNKKAKDLWGEFAVLNNIGDING